jgi:hypothetical protein
MRSGYDRVQPFVEGSLAEALQERKNAQIDDLLAAGWTIRSENGRQVILTRDGESKTCYRPR